VSGTEGERADPLEMAQNTVAAVLAVAHAQTANPLESYVHRMGERAFQSAQLGACMALISAAGDLRRIADALEVRPAQITDQLARIASALEEGELG
jgi:hypothetical protein